MIEPTFGFKDSDGTLHATVEGAQISEITKILAIDSLTNGVVKLSDAASRIVENKEQILDLFTTNANSRPGRRSVNGAKRKPRKPKTDAAQPSLTPDPVIPK